MPSYQYVGINAKGKDTKGTVDSDSIRSARQKLKAKGIYITNIKEGEIKNVKKGEIDLSNLLKKDKITAKELSIITRQLATLVNSGLPLVSALQTLPDQTDSSLIKRTLINVREDVEEGSNLAKALAKYPKSFPKLFINMVEAGEASGTLDTVLLNLAEYLEQQLELKRKIRSALTYPGLMLIVCTLVIIGLFVFVVPNIVEMFTKQGAVLPLPTRIMISISNFLIGYWPFMIIAVVVLIYAISNYYKQEKGRSKIDLLLLNLPIFGPIYLKVATAKSRFKFKHSIFKRSWFIRFYRDYKKDSCQCSC